MNDTPYSVKNVGVRAACIDPEGRIIDGFYNGIDLRRMDPGDSESFQFSDANGDREGDTEPLIYVAGVIRN